MRVWRLIVIAAAAWHLLADPARAQTVVVSNAAPGSTVELLVNQTTEASVIADATGLAVLRGDAIAPEAPAIEAQIWMDRCGDVRRVLIVDVALPVPPADACVRTPIDGLYRVQAITSIVIDVAGDVPLLRIRQGAVPSEWLTEPSTERLVARPRVPRGLVLSGGGGLAQSRDFAALACGNVPCDADDVPPVWTAGATFWFLPFVGVEGTFLRPGTFRASGFGQVFEFESEQEGGMLTVAGKGGLPLGPVRVVGAFGANLQQTTHTMAQRFEERTLVVDGSPVVIPGGTQIAQSRTEGWGWIAKGGAEWWLMPYVGVYGEAGLLRVTGDATGETGVVVDDRMTFFTIGGVLRVPGL